LDSAAYVPRKFESTVLSELFKGNWVLLLGPRQHGKTTGLLRVGRKIGESGFGWCLVDLQRFPPCNSYAGFLYSFATRVAAGINAPAWQAPVGAAESDLFSWLNAAVPSRPEPVVIIIDEAASIPSPEWRTSLYGQIRSISNERASAPGGSLASRLRFVFSGTFQPEVLVSELNSPFNVSTPVMTDDLTEDQARSLAASLRPDGLTEYASRAFSVVGGQPYLLQYILSSVSGAQAADRDLAFEGALADIRAGGDHHIQRLFAKIVASTALRSIVSRMLTDGEVAVEPANPDFVYLEVLGVAARSGARLRFRNQLYEEAARGTPQLAPTGATVPAQSSLRLYPYPPRYFSFIPIRSCKSTYHRLSAQLLYHSITAATGCVLPAMGLHWKPS
jgi:hypothetical protein